MTAIAITEPRAGSDVAGLSATARLSGDGTHYVLNGVELFVSGGAQADPVLVACRTSVTDEEDRRKVSLLLAVDAHAEGVAVSAEPCTLGLRFSDLVEVTFTDVRVEAAGVLGEPGEGFARLAEIFPQERLGTAVGPGPATCGAAGP